MNDHKSKADSENTYTDSSRHVDKSPQSGLLKTKTIDSNLDKSNISSKLEVQEVDNSRSEISMWQVKPRYMSAITPEVDYLTQSYVQTVTSPSKLMESNSINGKSKTPRGEDRFHFTDIRYTNSTIVSKSEERNPATITNLNEYANATRSKISAVTPFKATSR